MQFTPRPASTLTRRLARSVGTAATRRVRRPRMRPRGALRTVAASAIPLAVALVMTAADSQLSAAGAPSASARANVFAALVINEVDYDQPGGDSAEFVEIYNDGGSAVSLNGVRVLGVNGDGTVYRRVVLPSVLLGAGDFYVVGATGVPNLNLDIGTTNLFQNGSPDGVALVFSESGEIADEELIDSVSYEGNVVGGPPTGGTWTETAGVDPADDGGTADESIGRHPDGADTDDNEADFAPRCATPGEPNGAATPCASTPTPGSTPSATPTPTASATATPSATASPTPAASLTPTASPTPSRDLLVELAGLGALRRSDGRVVVVWRTLSEIDHSHFRVLRWSEDGAIQAWIGPPVLARGSALEGAEYRVIDRAAPSGEVSYSLEDVDTTGGRTRHGPATAPPALTGHGPPGSAPGAEVLR